MVNAYQVEEIECNSEATGSVSQPNSGTTVPPVSPLLTPKSPNPGGSSCKTPPTSGGSAPPPSPFTLALRSRRQSNSGQPSGATAHSGDATEEAGERDSAENEKGGTEEEDEKGGTEEEGSAHGDGARSSHAYEREESSKSIGDRVSPTDVVSSVDPELRFNAVALVCALAAPTLHLHKKLWQQSLDVEGGQQSVVHHHSESDCSPQMHDMKGPRTPPTAHHTSALKPGNAQEAAAVESNTKAQVDAAGGTVGTWLSPYAQFRASPPSPAGWTNTVGLRRASAWMGLRKSPSASPSSPSSSSKRFSWGFSSWGAGAAATKEARLGVGGNESVEWHQEYIKLLSGFMAVPEERAQTIDRILHSPSAPHQQFADFILREVVQPNPQEAPSLGQDAGGSRSPQGGGIISRVSESASYPNHVDLEGDSELLLDEEMSRELAMAAPGASPGGKKHTVPHGGRVASCVPACATAYSSESDCESSEAELDPAQRDSLKVLEYEKMLAKLIKASPTAVPAHREVLPNLGSLELKWTTTEPSPVATRPSAQGMQLGVLLNPDTMQPLTLTPAATHSVGSGVRSEVLVHPDTMTPMCLYPSPPVGAELDNREHDAGAESADIASSPSTSALYENMPERRLSHGAALITPCMPGVERQPWTLCWLVLAASVGSRNYDSRSRALIRRMARLLLVPWQWVRSAEIAFCKEIIKSTAPPAHVDTQDPDSPWNRERMIKYGLIGGGAVAGGVVLAVTGGLAAPAIVAGLGLAGAAVAGAGVVGAGAASFAASVAAFGGLSTALGVSFGAAGAGLVGYKMHRRTGKRTRTRTSTRTRTRTRAHTHTFVCICG